MNNIYCFLIIFLLFIAVIDYRSKTIPNIACLIIIVVGIVSNTVLADGMGLALSLFGFLAGFSPMFLIYLITGIGAGDVKLMGAIGTVVGIQSVILIFYFSFLFSGIYALVLLLYTGALGNLLQRYSHFFIHLLSGQITLERPDINSVNAQKLPMAPGIALAACYVLWPHISIALSIPFSSFSNWITRP